MHTATLNLAVCRLPDGVLLLLLSVTYPLLLSRSVISWSVARVTRKFRRHVASSPS